MLLQIKKRSFIGIKNGSHSPKNVLSSFQNGYKLGRQPRNNDRFCIPPVMNAQSIISTDKHPDGGVRCVCYFDLFVQAHGKILSCFRHSSKANILQSHVTQNDFRSLKKSVSMVLI